MNDLNDKTVPAHSMPPVSSGTHGQGDQLLQSGMMLPPQAPGILGVIGKYQVIKILGEGGMGQVLLAREPVTDSMVAIKLIKPEYIHKEWAVHRFLTEARHMFRMSHPSIIRVLDVSDRPEGPYFVMPFMAGGSLAGKIKPGEQLSGETILPVARAVAEALQHAHGRGITHRDLKPANILLDADGHAHLADFGLLRTFFNDSVVDTSQPQIEGTVPYMSPAVAAGKAEDTRCDIYAFGCLLYEMLTSRPPYQAPTVDAMLKQIQDGPPPPIRQLNPHAHVTLTAIAEHAMARELRDRYASMADVVADLERVAQGHAPVGPHGKERGAGGLRKAMVGAGIVAIVGLAGFGISQLPLWQSGGNSDTKETPSNSTVAETGEISPGTEKLIDLGGGVTMKLVWIPATTSEAWKKISGGKDYFVMGSPPDEIGRNANETQHEVKLTEGFWLEQTEVTQAQWEKVMGNNPSRSKGKDLPVESVNWDTCQIFLAKLPVPTPGWKWELPTEAQWEHACRAGTSGPYAGNLDQLGWYGGNSDNKTHPVATKKPNAWSLFDMHGNVWEWCRDRATPKVPSSPAEDPEGPSTGTDRLNRGGSHHIKTPDWYCRAAYRNFSGQAYSDWSIGFRPAMIPSTAAASSAATGTAKADPDVAPLVEGPFSYTVIDGAVTIVKYTGPGGDVVIPDKIDKLPVTGIGDGAFYGCAKLTGVTIPGTVTTIGRDAFNECGGLKSVMIPNGVASIHFNAFTCCHSLTTVKIPASVTMMGANPFSSCSGLMSIVVDEANPAYSSSADGVVFNKDKTILVSYPGGKDGGYTIPDGVTEISQSAFRYCVRLTDVTIPASVKTIGLYAFRNCQNLTSIHFKGNPPAISGPTFEYTDSVTIYYLAEAKGWSKLFGGRPTAVWEPAKDSKPSLPPTSSATPEPRTDGPFTYTAKDGKITITKYTGPGGNLTIPDKINGMPVTGIGTSAFFGCTGLTGVTIPNSVTDIGGTAFYRCAGLTRVNIPASVTTVGDAMFAYCNELAAVTVDPANPNFCSSADGVMFSKDKTCLILCPNGKAGSYEIPASVTQIRPNAFDGCLKLTTVVIPKGVKRIEGYTFKGCTNLTGVTIPDSVTLIGRMAFQNCTSLARITIPNNVASIEGDAFNTCTKLVGITIPASVTTLGATPFSGCSEMSAITVDEANPAFASIDGVLFDKQKTTLLHCPAGKAGDYTMPGGVTKISLRAFAGCPKLTSITIPGSLTEIADGAFAGCTELVSITIPASVTSIEPDAIFGSSKLAAIMVDPANPAFSSSSDGVLFNKGKTKLVRCPVSKAGSYVIPNGVTSIERQAFNGCSLLTDVTIPDSVTTICDSYVFSGCTRLSRVTIGKGMQGIGKLAFNSCGSLATVLFTGNAPNGVADMTIFNRTVNATVCYLSGATGWGKEFGGRPTALWDPKIPFVFTADNRAVAITKYTGAGGDVIIPDKINGMPVTRIGDNAFIGCVNATSIKIPATVTAIGDGAFSGCTGLVNITIPANVASIEPDAFLGCGKMTAIMVDAANTAYSSSADGVLFNKDKTKLIRWPVGMAGSYVIPNGVTSIERRAFNGCVGLTDVTIPDSVTTICDDYVFSTCPRLSQVNIGKGITSIGNYTFNSCSGLTGVIIKGNAPGGAADLSIFTKALQATVYYQVGTTGWGKEFGGRPTAVWDPKPPFTYTTARGAVTITKYTGPGGEVAIPDRITGLPVTVIGDNAFYGCATMTAVTIPNSVTVIGAGAFANCSSLGKITIGSAVTRIGDGAFIESNGLTAFLVDPANPAFASGKDGVMFDKTMAKLLRCPPGKAGNYAVPAGVTTIGPSAFAGCHSLANVTTSNSVTSIEASAFTNCSRLVKVAVSASVTKLMPDAFAQCSRLTAITVDGSNPTYSSSADGIVFNKDKTKLVRYPSGKAGNFTIPAGVTQLEPGAFQGTPGLTGVTIPVGVTSIPDAAFNGCAQLASVTIPDSVTSIGAWAFGDCPGLKEFTIPKGVTTIGGGAFHGCTGLTSASIPANVTEVGWMAFGHCYGITSISLANGVAALGDYAFYYCTSLTKISIPASVKSIGVNPFRCCFLLDSITVDASNAAFCSEDGALFDMKKSRLISCPGGKTGYYEIPKSVTTIGGSAFRGCLKLSTVMLPDGVTDLERRAFKYCTNIKEIIFQGNAPKLGSEVFVESAKATIYHIPGTKGWDKEFGGRPTAQWDPKIGYCYTIDKDTVTITKYIGRGGDVSIPGKIGGMPVTTIAEAAFQNGTTLTSLTVPAGVTGIMGRAFDGCTGLTKVTLPASVTSMGDYPAGKWNPFVNCPKLVTITVAAANPAFRSNTDGILFNKEMTTLLAYPGGKAGSYTIPDSVTGIGLAAFEGCAELTEVKIPRGVIALGSYSGGRAANPFVNCPKLVSLTVDAANPAYSSNADGVVFNKDKSTLVCYPAGRTGSYDIPDGVTAIGESAFAFCPGLTSLTIPASLTTINAVAFMNSVALAQVCFKGNAPTRVISNAFQGAVNTTVYYLPTTTGWAATFAGRPTALWDSKAMPKDAPTPPSVPEPVQVPIPPSSVVPPAFAPGVPAPAASAAGPFNYTTDKAAVTIVKYTGQGKDVVIPEKINGQPVTGIGEQAFMGCASLLDVTIPVTVTSMGGLAFSKCPNLTSAHFLGNAPVLGQDVFQDSPKATIYYLTTTTGWGKEFAGRPTAVWEQGAKAEN